MTTYTIRNWQKFQHYGDRKMHWVKVYVDLLDDMDWHELDPVSAKTLIALWLLAGAGGGELPSLKIMAFRLRTTETKLEQILNNLSPWVEQSASSALADGYQSACLEKKREEREEERVEGAASAAPSKNGTRLVEDWTPSPECLSFAEKKLGAAGAAVELEKFRNYWLSLPGKKATKLDWNRTWRNWCHNVRSLPGTTRPQHKQESYVP